ncbi:MAG: VWA domain-containing protein [Polyangiaceae bacterium]|nr:VWA domain-containing protein [Polyangiaceae bacterium]
MNAEQAEGRTVAVTGGQVVSWFMAAGMSFFVAPGCSSDGAAIREIKDDAYGSELIGYRHAERSSRGPAESHGGRSRSGGGNAQASYDAGISFSSDDSVYLEAEPFPQGGDYDLPDVGSSPAVPEPVRPPAGTGGTSQVTGEPATGGSMSWGGAAPDGGSSGMDSGGASVMQDGLDSFLLPTVPAYGQGYSEPAPGQGSSEPERNDVLSMMNARVAEVPWVETQEQMTSTFSLDADGASWTLARNRLESGRVPESSLVRVEEMLNYFDFHWSQPTEEPLSAYTELGPCPWNEEHELVLLGAQGLEVSLSEAPPLNLVYLLDTSGSMQDPGKLPLLKSGFRMLSRQLRPQDRVSIITYAGSERVVLEGTPGDETTAILSALDRLNSGGATNGSGALEKAYELASEFYIEDGINRVLLATDGDFNLGITETADLEQFAESQRARGIFLSVYGYGGADSRYNDQTAETLANHGNGIYFYIDGPEETLRAFHHTVTGSLIAVAKDVKFQVQFNEQRVQAYRLIGYENRLLKNDDFTNDRVDAGELGAGMSVTALYEVIPVDSANDTPIALPGTVPEGFSTSEEAVLNRQLEPETTAEMRLRFQDMEGKTVSLRATIDEADRRQIPSAKYAFAAGIAEWAQELRHSQYMEPRSLSAVIELLESARGLDGEGAVAEAIEMLERYGQISAQD